MYVSIYECTYINGTGLYTLYCSELSVALKSDGARSAPQVPRTQSVQFTREAEAIIQCPLLHKLVLRAHSPVNVHMVLPMITFHVRFNSRVDRLADRHVMC